MDKRYLTASAAVIVASIILVSCLMLLGVKGRFFSGGGVVMSRTQLGAHKALKERGGMGRAVVCISRHSHSTALDDMKLIGYKAFPVTPISLTHTYRNLLNSENLLWVLMQEGVARKIIYAIPDEDWERVSSKIDQRTSAPPLDINFRGSHIFIYTMYTLPVIREKVILFIDSSVSSTMEPERLINLIKEKGIDYDLAVLTDYEAGGQERTRQLASLLRESRD